MLQYIFKNNMYIHSWDWVICFEFVRGDPSYFLKYHKIFLILKRHLLAFHWNISRLLNNIVFIIQKRAKYKKRGEKNLKTKTVSKSVAITSWKNYHRLHGQWNGLENVTDESIWTRPSEKQRIMLYPTPLSAP